MVEDIKKGILEALQSAGEDLSSRFLMRKLGIPEKYSTTFYTALNQLRREKKISVNSRHIVRLHGDPTQRIPATIVSLSRSFAFARPDDGGDDMFLHGEDLHDAFLGDSVVLGNVRQSPKGSSCEVLEITQRAGNTVNGTIVRSPYGVELHPDAAIRFDIPIADFAHCGAEVGDKVQADISRLPHSSRFSAKVVKNYGHADCAKICADAILDANSVKVPFSPEALAEAEAIGSRPITEADMQGRADYRGWPICSIDSASAKDLDDAISIVRTPQGYQLGVHIADVSYYVRPGTALDEEARKRATSVYLPDRVVPMLPEAISNGVCSLNAGTDKLTFSAVMDFDKAGKMTHYEFHKSIINSKVRGVYDEVNQIFDGTAGQDLLDKYAPVLDSLAAGRELAGILKANARANGNFDIDSSESEFILDEKGHCIDVLPRHTGPSEQMIEQLMIAANQAAAKLGREQQLPFVYRVHENPDPDRVDALKDLLVTIGLNPVCLSHPADVTAKDFAQVMAQAAGTPREKVVSHQLLRTMAKARYDTKPLGHFGLALQDYCHFTSPIRRYPDTSIHRIMGAYLAGEDKAKIKKEYTDFAQESAKHSSEREICAMNSERSADDCFAAEYMAQHLGEEYDGIISGVTMRGVFVELSNSVEGFVPVADFTDKHFEFDGRLSQVDEATRERLTIGDPLRVVNVAADVSSGRIDFTPAGYHLVEDKKA
ncbi:MULTISPECIES: ribonuclease R [Caproicibacterium]|jgi:ribonuclease R|uniref:Ribonuclease R n=1 Tax=Caproicibacterium lactatifermentans TaxID=2666138 RepID=A0A859DPY2_9FIRM|nr:ribonuclease R [Caproicibacterium lactatifermentans]ARP50763.1 ribonuclease R [Ruminococcaceae bacterium CPB6]MDD4808200.1 ribonuclease R [Oscillospiraceae bacterium]QKN23505.1 ribonuclease R [Caproicibacterium lactatifermentans]QKO29817.1 ribonuclease R [Caproicibacterium lactatifermentans]